MVTQDKCTGSSKWNYSTFNTVLNICPVVIFHTIKRNGLLILSGSHFSKHISTNFLLSFPIKLWKNDLPPWSQVLIVVIVKSINNCTSGYKIKCSFIFRKGKLPRELKLFASEQPPWNVKYLNTGKLKSSNGISEKWKLQHTRT